MKNQRPAIGSSLDDFLKEEGTFEVIRATAMKEILVWQIEKAVKNKKA